MVTLGYTQETKTGRLMQLPPSPDTVVKKGRKSSDVPRSLQRMLQLKVRVQLLMRSAYRSCGE